MSKGPIPTIHRSGEYSIEVYNLYHFGGNLPEGFHYIGRPGRGQSGSGLANPRAIGAGNGEGGVWTRGDTVDLFERDFLALLKRGSSKTWWNPRRQSMEELPEAEYARKVSEARALYRSLQPGAPLRLICFCAPAPCHGDAIARTLLDYRVLAGR